MKIKNTYPPAPKKTLQRKKLLNILRGPFLLAGIVCPIINFLVGGKQWSVIVIISLIMVWKLLFSTDLVEYNRISQFVKLITGACCLLFAIDLVFKLEWAIVMDVIPIVAFGGIIGTSILFFTDFEKQKRNIFPMLFLIFFCLVASIVAISILGENTHWALFVMGGVALAQLIAIIISLGGEFFRTLRRRFHLK